MSGSSSSMLDVKGMSLNYGMFAALKNIDLTVNAGEIVSVIGANGAGKSSLIKGICGIEPSTGKRTFNGSDLEGRATSEITRMGIGLVPEGRKLFPSLSVEENIRLGAQLGSDGSWTLERIIDLFPELSEKLALPGTAVSGGQQQMVAIGRALMTNPRVLLCDEISLGLAPTVINRLYALLKKLAGEGISILVVEQAVHKSLEISDRYYCMLEGQVSLSGVSAEANDDDISRAYFGR